MKTISQVMLENLLQALMFDLNCNIIDLQEDFKITPDSLQEIIDLELYLEPKEALTYTECYELVSYYEGDPKHIAEWPILHQYLDKKLG